MDRGNVLSGAAFKAVTRSAGVFLVTLFAMSCFSIWLIDNALQRELRLRVLEMEQSLRRVAEEDGAREFTDWVAAAARTAAGDTLAYGLYAPDGTRFAGNTDVRLASGEWREVIMRLDRATPDGSVREHQPYLLHGTQIDGMVLVVGRSMAIASSARVVAIRGFALTGFVVVLAMLAIGYVLSRRSLIKLERIEDALDLVSAGETGARIGAGSDNDQIDRISHRIDARLDQLEELMQDTRRTAASVAHDLRRPLARATIGLEKALAKAEAGQDPRGAIENAQADLTRLTSIISTILRIARIEGGAVGELGVVDLRPILSELAETYQPVAEDAGQTLVWTEPEGPLMVRGDGGMLAQLFINLIQNAIAHTGEGARIHLSARAGPQAVQVCVRDNGPGIPEALRERVFEAFFRDDEARTVEGSGLGLPMVKAIVKRHGATIHLEDAAPGLRVRVEFSAASAV